jgi:colanic acid/amylovoran biosynthesis glycosyltransferase
MHWNKGYHFALDALKKLSDNGFDFHYTIIAGLNAEEILYQVQDLQLNNFVTLYKSLPQETVFEHMRKAHLLLLPSFEEGVANVVLEAMAVGLPVLSSDCGGMLEVITHNENGYLYRKRDLLDLQEKLMFIFNSSAESRMLIAEKAKNYVMRQHTLEILGSEMELFYSDIMNPEK